LLLAYKVGNLGFKNPNQRHYQVERPGPLIKGLSLETKENAVIITVSGNYTNLYPLTVSLGYFSLSIGLGDGSYHVLRCSTQKLELKSGFSHFSFVLNVEPGNGEVLTELIADSYGKFVKGERIFFHFYGLEFGQSEEKKFSILSAIILKRILPSIMKLL